MTTAFETHIETLASLFVKGDTLAPLRKKGWERYQTLGLPQKQQEGYHYLSLRSLYQTTHSAPQTLSFTKEELTSLILPQCKNSYLVFVNGDFKPELSDLSGCPQDVIALPLSAAMRSHGHFLQQHIARTITEETDPLGALNLAFQGDGLFFYLPPHAECENIIQCLHLITGQDSVWVTPRIHLMLGKHSSLKWITTYHSKEGSGHLVNLMTDLHLDEEASFSAVQLGSTSAIAWHFEQVRAQVKSKGCLKVFHATRGSQGDRRSYQVALKGEEASVELKGLWTLDQLSTAHTAVTVRHEAPHTRSMQLFKGVLDGSSHSSFEGKIFVEPEAQKTEAYQLNRNLLLSPTAIANSRPNLEIFADDVKASHGSTTSQLGIDQLFYFKSRGIEAKEAQQLLVRSFWKEMLEDLPSCFKEVVAHYIEESLHGSKA